MAKLKKYTLADLMLDRKKAQQRAMSSMGDVYKFDTNGHLVDEPVEENNTPYDTVWVGNKSYQSSTKLTFSSYVVNEDSAFNEPIEGLMLTSAEMGLFRFFAQNTDVEWTALYQSSNGKFENSTLCNIQTSHQKEDCNYVLSSFILGGDYNTTIHNHPGNHTTPQNPSDEDRQSKDKEYEDSDFKLAYFGVYNKNTDKIYFY